MMIITRLAILLLLCGPVLSLAAAPTLTDYQETSCATIGSGQSKTTPTVTWGNGSRVVVMGLTGDQSQSMATLTTTGSGLNFTGSLIQEAGDGGDTHVYVWSAATTSASSGTISSLMSNGGSGCLAVFVYSGSDGLGNNNEIANSSATEISLTISQGNSAVIAAFADWNAVNDTAVTSSPSTGATQRIVDFVGGQALFVTISWADEATGSRSYGFTDFVGGGDFSGIVIEVLGTAGGGGGPTCRGGVLLMGVGGC